MADKSLRPHEVEHGATTHKSGSKAFLSKEQLKAEQAALDGLTTLVPAPPTDTPQATKAEVSKSIEERLQGL
ncbi:hypothetical protein AB0E69_01695 [Kribbella sp. NPDC026611]|uniref:hypothetical protein n=1 Tax=Kribbella sp. NPDC026611 TaxID=3154911 RepID=UPI0033D6E662